jgi:ELWxxDGT repeat protein
VAVALLSGCTAPTASPPPAEEGGAVSAQDATVWTPCTNLAVPVGPAPESTGTESPELVHGSAALFYFSGDQGTGRGLWTSSGTRGAGAVFVKALERGPTGQEPSALTRAAGRVFFAAGDAQHGMELWVSDGTPAGTHLVKDLWPGEHGSFPSSLFEYKGQLYFTASDEQHGRELWRSDGTAEGTVLLADLDPGPEGTSPDQLTLGGDGFLYFFAHFQDDTVLMRSDGGPTAVELFRLPPEGSILESLTPVGKRIFFVAGDLHEHMVHLMMTEGGAPPVRVGMFAELRELVALGGKLYFTATSGHEGTDAELWRSDGTPKGTRRVKDIRAGAEGSHPSGLTVLGKQLFFAADNGVHGRELWVSDGTDAGTRLFADLEPGKPGSSPEGLAALQGQLFFSARTAQHGREAWVSAGLPGKTQALGELAPGAPSSEPRNFVRSGWDAFFTAEDGAGGRKLWALPLRPEGRCDVKPQ